MYKRQGTVHNVGSLGQGVEREAVQGGIPVRDGGQMCIRDRYFYLRQGFEVMEIL